MQPITAGVLRKEKTTNQTTPQHARATPAECARNARGTRTHATPAGRARNARGRRAHATCPLVGRPFNARPLTACARVGHARQMRASNAPSNATAPATCVHQDVGNKQLRLGNGGADVHIARENTKPVCHMSQYTTHGPHPHNVRVLRKCRMDAHADDTQDTTLLKGTLGN